MLTENHETLSSVYIHTPFSFIVDKFEDIKKLKVTQDDLYKILYVKSTSSIYVLKDIDPLTWMTFVGIKGFKGNRGVPGEVGPMCPIVRRGRRGDRGFEGLKGPVGYGEKGEDGDPGEQGPQGPMAKIIKDLIKIGDEGPVGEDGLKGKTGEDAIRPGAWVDDDPLINVSLKENLCLLSSKVNIYYSASNTHVSLSYGGPNSNPVDNIQAYSTFTKLTGIYSHRNDTGKLKLINTQFNDVSLVKLDCNTENVGMEISGNYNQISLVSSYTNSFSGVPVPITPEPPEEPVWSWESNFDVSIKD